MKPFIARIKAALSWAWRHASAVVALVLIVLAFYAGYVVATPEPEPNTAVATTGESTETSGKLQMYTCSMHPSVRLPDPDAKCPICFMDLIPVTEDEGGEGSERRIVLSEAANAISEIETAPVGRFFPRANVRLYGKVTYDETSVARLTAYFPGRIERLFVNYVGVPVAKGDHMAELYSPELLASFEELRQAKIAAEETRSSSDIVRRTTRDTLVATREKLRLFGLSEQQIESVESGGFEGERLTIYAPIGGVVTHLAAREGDYLQTGAPIATVANLSRLWLDLEAYESQLPHLRWGQRVAFTVEAHPGESFEGRISFIEPMVDEMTRTAAVRVAVDNTDRRLKPGMFASAVVRPRVGESGAVVSDELAGRWVSPMHPTIVKDGPGECDICGMDLVPAESLGVVGDPSSVREPLVIPRSAVLFTGARSVVYTRMPDTEKPTYESRDVILGPRAGEFYVVRSGLQKGERVVVNGAFRIDSAMQIAAKPSMMSPGDDLSDAKADVPVEFIHSLKPVYAAYLDAQEALADDNLDGFVRGTRDVRTALGLVQDSRLVGETLGAWRRATTKLWIDASLKDIETAREHFDTMSAGVIALLETFGHMGSEDWRLAHCPMAFDSTGADWIQRGEIIDNPYFGETMLRCGEIHATFAPLNASGHEGHDHD